MLIVAILFRKMSGRADYLTVIEAAIRVQHNCSPTHRETVFVHEKTRQNETVWEGFVEVFNIKGHRKAKVCYAWEDVAGDGSRKIFTVMESKIVDSPWRAVQAAIFSDGQKVRLGADKDAVMARQLARLRGAVEQGTEAVRRASLRTEDLDAAIEAAKQAGERTRQNAQRKGQAE